MDWTGPVGSFRGQRSLPAQRWVTQGSVCVESATELQLTNAQVLSSSNISSAAGSAASWGLLGQWFPP